MKKLFFILLLFCGFVQAQDSIQYTPMSAAGYRYKYLLADSGFNVPRGDTAIKRGSTRPGALMCYSGDNLIYRWNGLRWIQMDNAITNNCTTELLSGSVIWVNGFNFSNTLLNYRIGCRTFSTPASNFSITAADTTDRYTIVWADTLGNIGTRDGTTGAVASIPTVNPLSQILLATYFIPANATQPYPISNTVVYKENVEWTGTSNISGINFAYATNPYQGLYSTYFPSFSLLSPSVYPYVNYSNGADVQISSLSSISFYIRLGTAFNSSNSIYLYIGDGNGYNRYVVINSGQYGFNGAITGAYQLVAVPISSLINIRASNTINSATLTFVGSGGAVQIDNFILQSGGGNQSTTGVISYNGQAGNVNSIYQISADSLWMVHLVNGIRTDSFRILRTIAKAGTNMTIDMVGDTAVFNATGGSSSGVDSITQVGTYYYNNSWSDLSDFTDQGSNATISGNSINISGGTNTITDMLNIKDTTYYKDWGTKIRFKVNNTPSGTTYGIGIGVNPTYVIGSADATNIIAKLDLSTGADAGKISLLYYNIPVTLETTTGSPITFSANDSIELTLTKDSTLLTATATNLSNPLIKYIATYHYPYSGNPTLPNTGRFAIWQFGGNYNINSLNVTSNDRKYAKIAFIGDSKTQIYSASSFSSSFAGIINAYTLNVNSALDNTINFGAGRDRTSDVLSKINTIISAHPEKVFLAIGSNDKRGGVTNAVWFANYKSITVQLAAAGINVFHLLPFPETALDLSAYVDSIKLQYPTTYIDTWTPLLGTYPYANASYMAVDGIHPNDAGHSIIANQIIKSGYVDFFNTFKSNPVLPVERSLWTKIGNDIYPNNSGNVGIATTSPSVKFQVNDISKFLNADFDNTVAPTIYMGHSSYPGTYLNKISTSVSANTLYQKMQFSIANGASTYADVMSLTGAGIVGINTGSPRFGYLHIEGSSFPKTMISFNNASTANWGINMGSEAISNLYIGSISESSINNFFWRANWNEANRAINTFQSADPAVNSLPVLEILRRNTGNTGNWLNATSYGGTSGDLFNVNGNGNTGIGTPTPNASAQLDVQSTTKGFKPPVMTNAQMLAISTPIAGLMVANSDSSNRIFSYDGSNWRGYAFNGAIKAYPSLIVRNDTVSQRYNVRAFGAVGDGVTNDRAAFQAAINTIAAAKSGTLFVPLGTYIVDSLYIPSNSTGWATVEIEGESSPGFLFGTANTVVSPPSNGSIIKTNSTTNTIITQTPDAGTFSRTYVVLKNLDIRTYDSTNVSAVDMTYAAQLSMYNCYVNTDIYNYDAKSPQNVNACGIITPTNGNGAFTTLENVVVTGYGIGIKVNEHTYGDYIVCASNIKGLQFETGDHTSLFNRYGCYRNSYNVYMNGVQYFRITELNSERANSGDTTNVHTRWQQRIYDLQDPNNWGVGDIQWSQVNGGIGQENSFTKNGGSNILTRRIGTPLTTSIGDVIGSATAGSIFFSGTSSVLEQDNNNLFWNNTTKNLGVGIGAPNYKITTYGGAADADWQLITSNTGTAPSDGFTFTVENATKDVYINQHENADIHWYGNGAEILALKASHNVQMPNYGAGAATFDASGNITSVSDERLKTDIHYYKSGLKELMGLKPIQYKWNKLSGNEMKETYAGFSAQNVKANIPLGTGENKEGYLSLQDRAILATMVNAIQEQQAQIEALKKEIEDLKSHK